MNKGRQFGVEHKSTLKATMRPTAIDLAWAAGFIDGEGYFGVTNSGKPPCSQRVAVGQKDPESLYKLLAMFGGKIGMQKQMTRNLIKTEGVATELPYWLVHGPRARNVMMTLYPLMSRRRKAKIKESLRLYLREALNASD